MLLALPIDMIHLQTALDDEGIVATDISILQYVLPTAELPPTHHRGQGFLLLWLEAP